MVVSSSHSLLFVHWVVSPLPFILPLFLMDVVSRRIYGDEALIRCDDLLIAILL